MTIGFGFKLCFFKFNLCTATARELFERERVEIGGAVGYFDNEEKSGGGGTGGGAGRVTIGTLAEVDKSLAGVLEQTLTGADYTESLQNAMEADLLVGLCALFTHVILYSQNAVQLMTASAVHVNNLTPPWEWSDNPGMTLCSTTPIDDSQYGP